MLDHIHWKDGVGCFSAGRLNVAASEKYRYIRVYLCQDEDSAWKAAAKPWNNSCPIKKFSQSTEDECLTYRSSLKESLPSNQLERTEKDELTFYGERSAISNQVDDLFSTVAYRSLSKSQKR